MEMNFGPRGIVEINDCRICYKNFRGEASKFNREGDRNFAIIIPTTEMADALVESGWNVKVKEPRDEGDIPFMTLPVKVKFNDRGPAVYLQAGKNVFKLDEDTVGRLDRIDIAQVDLDIRPYDWEVQGKTGRTAYLQSIRVIQNIDRFAADMEPDTDETLLF